MSQSDQFERRTRRHWKAESKQTTICILQRVCESWKQENVPDAVQSLLFWTKQFAAPILVGRIRERGYCGSGKVFERGEKLGQVNPWISRDCCPRRRWFVFSWLTSFRTSSTAIRLRPGWFTSLSTERAHTPVTVPALDAPWPSSPAKLYLHPARFSEILSETLCCWYTVKFVLMTVRMAGGLTRKVGKAGSNRYTFRFFIFHSFYIPHSVLLIRT